jgi:hypothetical protein
MSKNNKPKLTSCPSPAYEEYRPDLATRIATARASSDQPAMMTMASSVPADYFARLDRTTK